MTDNGTARPLRAAFLGRHGAPDDPEPIEIADGYEARWFRDHGTLMWKAVEGWFANGGGPCHLAPLGSGTDPVAALATSLRMLDDFEFDVVCFPDLADVAGADLTLWATAQRMLVEACAARADRIALLDLPPGLTPQAVREWRIDVLGVDTPYAALYYPWLQVVVGADVSWAPPCGHVAGAWARGGSLGNLELVDVVDVETDLTNGEQDWLSRVGVNLLRALPSWGIRTRGARTLAADPWLFQLTTARLLTTLKQVVPEEVRRSAGDPTLALNVAAAVRARSGLAPDAFAVRARSDQDHTVCVEIDLPGRVTRGWPLTVLMEHPEQTWQVTGTEPPPDTPPPGHRG